MQDAWRAYLELALGLTEASKKKAQKVAKKLTSKGGATAAQLQAVAEDLVTTSTANRAALTKLVRFEVDRALGVVGLATADEVAGLNARVRDLEQQLREARGQSGSGPTFDTGGGPLAPVEPTPTVAAAKKAAARKSTAKKAVAKSAVAKKAVAKQSPARRTTVSGAAPVKKAAKKTVAKRAPGKRVAKANGAGV